VAHTATVDEVYRAFGRGDVQALLAHLADEVEWEYDQPSDVPFDESGRVARFRHRVDTAYQRAAFEGQ